MVVFVLLSLLPLHGNAFGLHASTASETIYIRSDGTIDPSTTPILRMGDLYVLNADITSEGNGIVARALKTRRRDSPKRTRVLDV
jgi:hypothetical protein